MAYKRQPQEGEATRPLHNSNNLVLASSPSTFPFSRNLLTKQVGAEAPQTRRGRERGVFLCLRKLPQSAKIPGRAPVPRHGRERPPTSPDHQRQISNAVICIHAGAPVPQGMRPARPQASQRAGFVEKGLVARRRHPEERVRAHGGFQQKREQLFDQARAGCEVATVTVASCEPVLLP